MVETKPRNRYLDYDKAVSKARLVRRAFYVPNLIVSIWHMKGSKYECYCNRVDPNRLLGSAHERREVNMGLAEDFGAG